jgi:transcriptional regulator GlxA family with amidase domain
MATLLSIHARVIASIRSCESSSLDGVLAEVLRFRAINHAIVPHAAATAAVNVMVAHYDQPLTVHAIAEATNVSERRLAHIFPDTTGFPVKDYLICLRVSIARRLLNETTHTLNVIATRTGSADVSHFSRTFKSIDGVSPGEFRRSRSGGQRPSRRLRARHRVDLRSA